MMRALLWYSSLVEDVLSLYSTLLFYTLMISRRDLVRKSSCAGRLLLFYERPSSVLHALWGSRAAR
jgi:hypothetical protein